MVATNLAAAKPNGSPANVGRLVSWSVATRVAGEAIVQHVTKRSGSHSAHTDLVGVLGGAGTRV